MPFYVYIIQSDVDKSYYKGFSTDPLQRLAQHNDRGSSYTSQKVPWQLVHVEVYATKREALIREKAIKKYDQLQLEGIINSPRNQLQAYLTGLFG